MFDFIWMPKALEAFRLLEKQARLNDKKKKRNSSRQQAAFKQVVQTLKLLASNPRHPGLNTHSYFSLPHPLSKKEKVFEAYVQNRTPGAYRVFWCYGPKKMRSLL